MSYLNIIHIFHHFILISFVLFNTFSFLLSQDSNSTTSFFPVCSSSPNCHTCISTPECAWCPSSKLISGASRCDSFEHLIINGCPDDEIINPKSVINIIHKAVDKEENSKSPIQMNPNKIKLKIRKNEMQKLTIKFKQSVDYPVDLYYLMDLTYSMKDHKEMLVQMADNLAASMANITKSFRLGFGSFIDKVVMPYANMVPNKLKNPCTDSLQCAPPYGFRNHLALNDNISLFISEVSAAPLSGNLDNAEGGFDAIMQVIVCQKHINWNPIARKIILFATDSIFHYAGDGKLGGIIKPNDGKCYLDNEGYYTESIYQDYPSLSQINTAFTLSKVNIIFAVPESSIEVYQQLATHIPGSVTGKLQADSLNIVDIIESNFKKIASRVELSDNSSSSFEIRYMTSCLSRSKRETKICENIRMGDDVEFDVEVMAVRCPSDGENLKETFVITPIGIEEYTQVEVEVICGCDCEREPHAIVDASECNGHGISACGICTCDANRFGKRCECDDDHAIIPDMIDQCKIDINSSTICSNHGECVCGECECFPRENPLEIVSGKYCECDSFSCARDPLNGLSCGGHDRGMCCNGECQCNKRWSGTVCECSTLTDTCINTEITSQGELCSNNGQCVCGSCRCDSGFYGQFCQDCASCEGQCSELQSCVECKHLKSGNYSPVECNQRCTFRYETFQQLDLLPNDRQCIIIDSEDCRIEFNYNYDDRNEVFVRIRDGKECPGDVNLYFAMGSIAGTIFLAGFIMLICIRMLIWWKDKIEFERFENERKKTKFADQVNPLYKEPNTKYANPMYNKNQS